MSDISADDYARLATEIGMVRQAATLWNDPQQDDAVPDYYLASYLAEPAQMERILKLDGLPGDEWLIERHTDPDDDEWIVSRQARYTVASDFEDATDYWGTSGGDTVGAAVRDCAARALRP